MTCLFCKILDGQIPSTRLYEDEYCIAIADIEPQAAVHVLVIPRMHARDLNECIQHEVLLGKLMKACATIAQQQGIAQDGYRVVTNIGQNGAQTVPHLHIHVLGGEQLAGKIV